jgi:hypothetical protein
MSAGIGDRWLAGEPVAGVAFGPHDRATLARGPRAGEGARILLLVTAGPEPVYLVATDAGDELHVRQSALRAGA